MAVDNVNVNDFLLLSLSYSFFFEERVTSFTKPALN